MQTGLLGKTGIQVSWLGLGTHELSNSSSREVGEILSAALDAGINVIDTAECYGQSEEKLGHALGTRRRDCYLFTKCGHAADLDLPDWSPHLIEASVERSLRRLRTDYVDVLLLHSCSLETLRRGEVIQALQAARTAGKVRFIGYSGDRAAARYAAKCGAFDVLEISVNIADQEAIDRVLPPARANQLGIIAKRPLANLTWHMKQRPVQEPQVRYWERLRALQYEGLAQQSEQRLELALRFTLSVPGINVAIVGTTNPKHLAQNVIHVEAGPLPQEQFQTVRQRWKALTWWRGVLPGARYGWHGCI